MNVPQHSIAPAVVDRIDDRTAFRFGSNWRRFLSGMDEARIARSLGALEEALDNADLTGKTFLDAGCGSGLSSLAARRTQAKVLSFDYDPESVACADLLKRTYAPGDTEWHISHGSVLDPDYLGTLGMFDVVYSWGVLHHSGAMWRGVENLVPLVAPRGIFMIALYNDQGWISRYWSFVKRSYVRHPAMRWPLLLFHAPYLFVLRALVRALSRRGRPERGMSLWHDMRDWVGGFPFEVARPEQVLRFLRERGFELVNLKTCGGRHGCNEYVFRKYDGAGGVPALE